MADTLTSPTATTGGLLGTPSSTSPPGVTHTLTSAAYTTGDGPMVLAVCWSMTAVAALFLGLRLYVKLTTHKRLWWDDHFLVASWLMLVAFSAATTFGLQDGLGMHFEDLKGTNLNPASADGLQLIVVVATVFSVVGAAWSKTSFALTLLRITSGTMHYVIWFIIVSMNVVLTFNAILQFLWCQPASVAWSAGQGGTCWSRSVIIYYSIAAAAYSATMDVLLAMVPWVVIMKLNMQMKEKIGVAVCMSLGFFAAMTSIFRAIHIPAIYSDDYTYDEGELFIWTAAELATTIVAASIPVLRALLKSIVNSTRRTRRTGVNTFKNGTYVCSTVSRSQSYYRRMEGQEKTTAAHRAKAGGDGNLASISENGESVSSLVMTPARSLEKDLLHGGIMKTEEITVDYDRRSRQGTEDKNGDGNAVLGFELQEVTPVFTRSVSTKR